VLTFIGGRERVLHKDADLGFHQPSIAGQGNACDSTGEALLEERKKRSTKKFAYLSMPE